MKNNRKNKSPFLKDIEKIERNFDKKVTLILENKGRSVIEPLPVLQELLAAEILFNEWNQNVSKEKPQAQAKMNGSKLSNTKRLVRKVADLVFLLGGRNKFESATSNAHRYKRAVKRSDKEKIKRVQLKAAKTLTNLYTRSLALLMDTRFADSVVYRKLSRNETIHRRHWLALQTSLITK